MTMLHRETDGCSTARNASNMRVSQILDTPSVFVSDSGCDYIAWAALDGASTSDSINMRVILDRPIFAEDSEVGFQTYFIVSAAPINSMSANFKTCRACSSPLILVFLILINLFAEAERGLK